MGVRSRKSADDGQHCSLRKRTFTNLVIYRYCHRFGGPPQSVAATSDSAPSSITSSTPRPSVAAGRGKEIRDGILPRSIRKLGPSTQVISGRSLLVDQILSLSGAASVAEFVGTKLAGDTSAFLPDTNTGIDAICEALFQTLTIQGRPSQDI